MNPDIDDPNLTNTRVVLESMGNDVSSKCLIDLPCHLSTFIRDHVMRDRFSGKCDSEKSIQSALDSATKLGSPPLRGEARDFAATRGRVGDCTGSLSAPDDEHAYFDCPEVSGILEITSATALGHRWAAADFGDTIPEIDNDPIWEHYGGGNSREWR